METRNVGKFGRTALHLAAYGGHFEIARLLLDRGAAVNSMSACEETPLHCAASGGYVDCARLLLERGADVHAVVANLFTPLHDAAYEGHRMR